MNNKRQTEAKRIQKFNQTTRDINKPSETKCLKKFRMKTNKVQSKLSKQTRNYNGNTKHHKLQCKTKPQFNVTYFRKVVAKNPFPGFSTLCTSDRESSSLIQQCSAAPAWIPSMDSVLSGSLLASHLGKQYTSWCNSRISISDKKTETHEQKHDVLEK